jgi:hypothetical protein
VSAAGAVQVTRGPRTTTIPASKWVNTSNDGAHLAPQALLRHAVICRDLP